MDGADVLGIPKKSERDVVYSHESRLIVRDLRTHGATGDRLC